MTNTHISGMLAAASLAALGFQPNAEAQSFSCAKAKVPTEFEICNNENLLIRDEALAILYKKTNSALDKNSQKAGLKRSQQIWVNQRNNCQLDSKCIAKNYSARAVALENFAKQDHVPTAMPTKKPVPKKAGFWIDLVRGGPGFGAGLKNGVKLQ